MLRRRGRRDDEDSSSSNCRPDSSSSSSNNLTFAGPALAITSLLRPFPALSDAGPTKRARCASRCFSSNDDLLAEVEDSDGELSSVDNEEDASVPLVCGSDKNALACPYHPISISSCRGLETHGISPIPSASRTTPIISSTGVASAVSRSLSGRLRLGDDGVAGAVWGEVMQERRIRREVFW